MKYALINGKKSEAIASGERGICCCCDTETIAYCGSIKINHWRHKSLIECDKWGELETEWHRNWKNHFPTECQEIIMRDPDSGEKHIADVFLTHKNTVIEFQHSPIEISEITARENFYKNMLWVIDVSPYLKNIKFHDNVKDAFFDHVIMPWSRDLDNKFNKLKKEGKIEEALNTRKHGPGDEYIRDFEEKYNLYTTGCPYMLMQWKYQHKRWNYAKMPLLFDAGDGFLYRSVECIEIWNGFLVEKVRIDDLLNKLTGM
jgi:competence CoiA-like predicted nuclease